MFRVCARARRGVAQMLGIGSDRVAFLAHASEGLNQAVSAVEWRSGDNAVFADLEYPSLVYPAARLRDRGVEARVVPSRGYRVAVDDIAAAVDGRTRLLLVSQVSYLTGQRLDLARCAEIARARGAWLAVDVTHALGVAPVDASVCDFLVSACYKWLLATHGVGIFAFDPTRVGELAPNVIGWHSIAHRGGIADPLAMPLRDDASRLEAGNPSLLGLFVLDAAVTALMPHRATTVLAHAHALGDALIDGLRQRGRTVITPEPRDERAGNICFLADQPERMSAALAARGVLVWGSEGRIRVSAHLYNDQADVDRFFEALDLCA
jgi:selenocysteine lyase/cysteine desulfurase